MRLRNAQRLSWLVLAAVLLAAGTATAQLKVAASQWVDEPLKAGNLTIFPVHAPTTTAPAGYLTLDEALKRGALVVSEVGEGTVSIVIVTNTSDRPIYIMAGQIIIGGKQDRTIKDDVIILPGARNTRIKVYCVEQGRWRGDTKAFRAAPGVANLQVRGASQVDRSQSAVWDNVAKSNAALGTRTETGTYRAVMESADVRRRTERVVDALIGELPRGADVVGCVVGIGDKIVGADVFADATLFRKLWPQLLESYATEAAAARASTARRPTKTDAQAFLDRGAGGRAETIDTDGKAIVIERRGRGVVVIETKAAEAAAPVHQSFFAR